MSLDPNDPMTAQMVAAYQTGVTCKELAARYYMSRESVAMRLRRAGVEIRQGRPSRRRMTDHDLRAEYVLGVLARLDAAIEELITMPDEGIRQGPVYDGWVAALDGARLELAKVRRDFDPEAKPPQRHWPVTAP